MNENTFHSFKVNFHPTWKKLREKFHSESYFHLYNLISLSQSHSRTFLKHSKFSIGPRGQFFLALSHIWLLERDLTIRHCLIKHNFNDSMASKRSTRCFILYTCKLGKPSSHIVYYVWNRDFSERLLVKWLKIMFVNKERFLKKLSYLCRKKNLAKNLVPMKLLSTKSFHFESKNFLNTVKKKKNVLFQRGYPVFKIGNFDKNEMSIRSRMIWQVTTNFLSSG